VTAWRAIADSVMRSAHSPPHHARSPGVAKHHTEAPGRTSSVQRQPAVERWLVWIPAKGTIVTVARSDQPARLAHAPHFAQCANGIVKMLEHLVRVYHVERVVGHLEGIEVADRKLDVGTTAGVAPRLLDHRGRRIDAEDSSGRNPPADVSRDCARPAPKVEHAGAGGEVRCEVSGRVIERAPLVRPQHAFVVTVRVDQGHRNRRARDYAATIVSFFMLRTVTPR